MTTLYSRVFIAIDALDECQASHGYRTALLSEMFSLQVKSGANLFATSRFLPEITEKLNKGMMLEIRATNQDVQRYLEGHMSQLPTFVLSRPKLQEEIITELVEAIEGM